MECMSMYIDFHKADSADMNTYMSPTVELLWKTSVATQSDTREQIHGLEGASTCFSSRRSPAWSADVAKEGVKEGVKEAMKGVSAGQRANDATKLLPNIQTF